MKPGEVISGEGDIECNQGRGTVTITVENTSDHAVQVTSHYHFFEANKRLRFDRSAAYGKRLDIPAGSGVRWEPGEVKEVRLVELSGKRRVFGFQGLVNGPLTDDQREEALARAREQGFLDREA
ncbi:MAG: urease subunit beta [Dehalococcoidia bacterium]